MRSHSRFIGRVEAKMRAEYPCVRQTFSAVDVATMSDLNDREAQVSVGRQSVKAIFHSAAEGQSYRTEDSAHFYANIFGWTVRERGDGNLAFDDTGGVSGTWVKEGDRTPDERTQIYIMVDNIAESLKQIVKAGGRVVTPRKDIGPNMGAFAAFSDPVGNEFGLYEEPQR